MVDGEQGWIDVVVDGDEGPFRTGFRGRWLTAPHDDNWSRLPGHPMSRCYGVGAGDDGRVYVYTYHLTETTPRRLDHYPSMAAALSSGVAADVVAYAVGCDVGHRAGRRIDAPAEEEPRDAASRVLLVSADAARSSALRRELESDGYAVTTAPDLKSARQAAIAEAPDVLFVDISEGDSRPDLDPWFSRRLRAGAFPVVLVTPAVCDRARQRRGRRRVPVAG